MNHPSSPCQAPLYKELEMRSVASSEDGRFTEHNSTYHKGLWFERFFNRYDSDWSVSAKAKGQWIKAVCGSCGNAEQLKSTNHRRIQMISSLGGEFGIFKLDWHFVTGMGNAHPVENGFSWHPTLGTPWIPGSTVKGLVRAWAERELIPAGTCDRALVYQLFGSESKSPDECGQDNRAGALVFFDAIPTAKVELITDIMTPHSGKWYEKGGSDQAMQADVLPGDWHSPVPVPFLVCKKASFLFGLAPREGCGVTSEQLGQAMLWLEDALMFWGIGAKTATGYGHMDKDEAGVEKQRQELQSQEEARKEQARLATMAPEEVAMDAVRQRMERGESQGAGAGCPLGNDLSQLFTQAKSEGWGSDLLETLIALGKSIYQHLGVDLKKNKKAKEKIRELEAVYRSTQKES